ncbi:MAG: C40 family peptidase [Gammaproteobacteria bacterium]|nr:C40 family peptidase [Gammaproteobacteria bacterium]NNM14555.1 C40 family peptidase [Gammaproteobacteria bacterium]
MINIRFSHHTNTRHKLLLLFVVALLGACSSTSPYSKPGSSQPSVVDSRPDNSSDARDRNLKNTVVMAALNQVGTPYKYGGSSPATGFDCSGLVQYSHSQAGLSVPRTTRKQMQFFSKVNKRDLRAGDLVFFQTGRNQYHVAIMLNQNEFVHAPSSGKTVSTSSFSNPYWKANFIKAGRL